jgi:hypothetical protein
MRDHPCVVLSLLFIDCALPDMLLSLPCATGKILIEYLTDGEAMRFLILICLPFQFAICHFFLVS